MDEDKLIKENISNARAVLKNMHITDIRVMAESMDRDTTGLTTSQVKALMMDMARDCDWMPNAPKTSTESSPPLTAQQEPVGVMVSMDVSQDDEPEYRIFGHIYEVQEDTDGITYLAIEESRNFTQPEQELVEDLQAKLKWATEQLEANINWEFVAAAKEEMLKAAWSEIKELRQEPKIHIESGMTADELWLSNGKLRADLADLKVQPKQPEQEPVQWGVEWGKAGEIPCVSIIKRLAGGGIEVVAVEYGPQRTWVGLTDSEWMNIVNANYAWRGHHPEDVAEEVAKLVETKLKEKNSIKEQRYD